MPGTTVVIRFPRLEDLHLRYTRELCRGGTFIPTANPRNVGTPIHVALEMPEGERITITAEVVTSVGSEEATARGVQAGMGIRFLDFTGDKRGTIEALLTRAMVHPPAPPPGPALVPPQRLTPPPFAAPTPSPPPAARPVVRDESLALSEATAAARAFLASLEGKDLYGMLEVPRDATATEIRNSFLTLTRRFHPDNYFRRAPEVLHRDLEEIYERLTIAYENLYNRDARIAYDISIGYLGGNRDGVTWEEMRRISAEEQRRKAAPARVSRAEQLLALAAQEMAAGQNSKAMANLRLALAFDPANDTIKAKIKELKELMRKK
jgi:Tfp pilus assembly protein PilZ